MKENLKLLELLSKKIEIEKFYCVTVTPYSIQLQGRPNVINVTDLQNIFDFKFDYDSDSCWLRKKIEFENTIIDITLTF
jgi:hypothetical protein